MRGEAYYTGLAREDYYTEGGEPPGKWWGGGAVELGLRGQVDSKTFRNLFHGFSADGKRALVRNAGAENRQKGWDLTFSAPKSVSALWAIADEGVRREIQDAQEAAVREALSYLEMSAGRTRRGHGGVERERSDLVFATFEHSAARGVDGLTPDPQLHTHALVLNLSMRRDGSTGTIESIPLFQHKMAAGALYRAELSAQLERRLGLGQSREGWTFSIDLVPESLTAEFSKRSEEIRAALRRDGLLGDTQAAAVKALETRSAKKEVSREQLFFDWSYMGQKHGLTPQLIRESLQAGPDRDESQEVREAIGIATERLTEHQSHFSQKELVRFVSEECQCRGVGGRVIRHNTWQYLQHSPQRIIPLGEMKGEARFATKEMFELEKRMLASAGRMSDGIGATVSEESLRSAISSRPTLNDEQLEAITHLTARTGQITLMRGGAGSGKTSYVVAAAHDVWKSEGYEVIGAALSGKAAVQLEKDSGIQSSTIHSLLSRLERGELQVTNDSILVIDEAGMVGSRQMESLLTHVEQGGAKIVLVGDERQLQPIAAGGAFKALAHRIGACELRQNMRQREGWMRQAADDIAKGKGSSAIEEFTARGLLHVGTTGTDTVEQLVSDWRESGEELAERLIFTGTRQAARDINRLCQREQMQAGKLGKEHVFLDSDYIYVGDRILFTRNTREVKNGMLGTVSQISEQESSLTAELDDGRRVSVDLDSYRDLLLGYAVTTHRTQGATLEESYVLMGGNMQDQEISYVQVTRTRGRTKLYADEVTAGEDLERLKSQVERSRQKDIAPEILEIE